MAYEALEFPSLLELLKRYLASPLGAWRLAEFAAVSRLPSQEAAELALREAAEAIDWLKESEETVRDDARPAPRFRGLEDVRPPLEKLSAEGAFLEAREIYGLLEALDRARGLREDLLAEQTQRPALALYGERLHDFSAVLAELSGKILPSGEVADSASPALNRIRRQLEHQRKAVHQSLDRFVRKHSREGVLQEDYVTIRNGRLVVPVKTEWKWRVEGVIHNASSSGQTVFVEPIETIEINNQLVRLLEDEQREIERILREMSARLRQEAGPAGEAVRILGDLEFLFAKAHFGREFKACIPEFGDPDDPRLVLNRARHPLLEDVLRARGERMVDLTLTLDSGQRVLIISGPNAGGKTVALKTVGLLALMAQAGVPAPAEEARFPWFDSVLADIGDAQSIRDSLSTFSAHVQKLRGMMERAGSRSLVLIDELGAATDPEEGGALGAAIVHHFVERGAFALVSTHLPALKAYAASEPAVRNAAVGFDERTLAPTYRLRVGLPGQSAGLAMAERFGIPHEVVERARRAMNEGQRQASDLIGRLHEQLRQGEQAEREMRQAERDLRERERRLARSWERREAEKLEQLRKEFDSLMKRYRAEHQAEIERLRRQAQPSRRAAVSAERRAAKGRRETAEQFQASAGRALGRPQPAQQPRPAPPAEIRPGAHVRIGDIGVSGQVLQELSGGRWVVQVGNLRMQVRGEEISEVLSPAPGEARPAAKARVPEPSERRTPREINVIGRSAEEACQQVDKFLDDAVMADHQRLRIIHGHGMNVLRKTLWQMFSSHPHVERYYQAEQNEGGAGATIVDVRRE